MNSIVSSPFRYSLILIVSVLFVSGCSNSSDSSSGESQTDADVSATNGEDMASVGGTDSGENEMEDANTGDTTSGTQTESTYGTDESTTGSGAGSTLDSEGQSTTRVDFDITVPVYVSNSLQVRLAWGDIDTTAMWDIDERWIVSADFPVATTNQLVVTFSDDNGAVTLGSFVTSFKTGARQFESMQIIANDFDTDRWDSDGDGVSNLSESIAGTNPQGGDMLDPAQASLELAPDKTFRITWLPSTGAQSYRVLENSDGSSGFVDISGELNAATNTYDHRVALYSKVNAQYLVQSCNAQGCIDSDVLFVSGALDNAIGYFKASNDEESLGGSAALSADGSTLAISGSAGLHVFVRSNENWQLQTLLSVKGFPSLSTKGDTLAIGVPTAGTIRGIDVPVINETTYAAPNSGAVYVFARVNGIWEQQVLLRASSSGYKYYFGRSVSISADGNTLAVSTPGVLDEQGAAYVFTRNDESWQEQAYLKASNPEGQICNSELPDCYRWGDAFGTGLDLSDDGNTLAIGAPGEDSAAIGINGNQYDNSSRGRGAVYVFVRNDQAWQQQAYVKPNFNYDRPISFGVAVALSATGDTLAVGIPEDYGSSGAVYVFERAGVSWQQQAFVKASNTDRSDVFGSALSLSADGNMLAVGAWGEDSAAIGINGDQADNSTPSSGAAYVLKRTAGIWQQRAYLKATDTKEGDYFGHSLSLSADGQSLVVSGGKSNYLY